MFFRVSKRVETHRDLRILLETTLASYIVEVPTFQKRLGWKEYVEVHVKASFFLSVHLWMVNCSLAP